MSPDSPPVNTTEIGWWFSGAENAMMATRAVAPKEHRALGGIRPALDVRMDDQRLVRWMMAWTTLFGHISLELFGHMYRGILDYDAHFTHVVTQLADDLGLSG